ncbi:MAG: hypothetical protein LT105_02990 [Lentimicrobium sp.]|nr:hypothetical protein [Lentimicrobium sp.]
MDSSTEILFFMICPLVMGGVWIVASGMINSLMQSEKDRALVNAVIGLMVTLTTTGIVISNLNAGKSEYAGKNIKLFKTGIFSEFRQSEDLFTGGDGSVWDISKTMACLSDGSCFEPAVTEGNENDYKPGERVLIYKLNSKHLYFLRKNILSSETAEEYAGHVQLYSIYYWNFLWICLSALVTISFFKKSISLETATKKCNPII